MHAREHPLSREIAILDYRTTLVPVFNKIATFQTSGLREPSIDTPIIRCYFYPGLIISEIRLMAR